MIEILLKIISGDKLSVELQVGHLIVSLSYHSLDENLCLEIQLRKK